jgi:hypothetical protein
MELGLRRSVISSIIATVTRQGDRPVSVLDSPRFARMRLQRNRR